MGELSKCQARKARRRQRAEEEKKELRKRKALCVVCGRINKMTVWKNAGNKCPECGHDEPFEVFDSDFTKG